LIVRISPGPRTGAAEFEAGRLSVIEVPFGETARWRAQHPHWLVEKPALRVVYVALNNRRGPLSDVRVRRAINQAVNVPEILATLYGGRGIRARGAIPPALAGSDTTRPAYDYDPAAARRLLAQAGYATGIDVQLWRTAAEAARTALYRRIDDRVYAAAPWLYLWFPKDLWAHRPELSGWDLPVIFNGQRWTHARLGGR